MERILQLSEDKEDIGVGVGVGVGVVESEQCTKWIRQYCEKHRLAGFKRPRIAFVCCLPRNS